MTVHCFYGGFGTGVRFVPVLRDLGRSLGCVGSLAYVLPAPAVGAVDG